MLPPSAAFVCGASGAGTCCAGGVCCSLFPSPTGAVASRVGGTSVGTCGCGVAPPSIPGGVGCTFVLISITVGVTVVMTSGVCSTGFNVVVGGARLLPPPMLSLFHDAQSSQPVADCSGCQKSGGGSLHHSGGSGRSHASTSSNVGAGKSTSVVGVGAGAPMSFWSPVGDRGRAAVGVVMPEGESGVVIYIGTAVSSDSAIFQYLGEIVPVVSTYAH